MEPVSDAPEQAVTFLENTEIPAHASRGVTIQSKTLRVLHGGLSGEMEYPTWSGAETQWFWLATPMQIILYTQDSRERC